MNIRNIIIVLAITLVSCSEPTPQELREQARQMVEIAAAQEKKIAREEANAQYCHSASEAIAEFEHNDRKHGNNQIFYLDGHKYRIWWGIRTYGEHIAVVHDPECEINDIKKIIRP